MYVQNSNIVDFSKYFNHKYKGAHFIAGLTLEQTLNKLGTRLLKQFHDYEVESFINEDDAELTDDILNCITKQFSIEREHLDELVGKFYEAYKAEYNTPSLSTLLMN